MAHHRRICNALNAMVRCKQKHYHQTSEAVSRNNCVSKWSGKLIVWQQKNTNCHNVSSMHHGAIRRSWLADRRSCCDKILEAAWQLVLGWVTVSGFNSRCG